MDFIDEIVLRTKGGAGGDGCVSFRREKYVAKGGPDGGDGGHGGAVVFSVDTNISTLFDLKHRKLYKAESGKQGRGKKMHGRNGHDIVVAVPPGTLVFDNDTGELLGDLKQAGDRVVAARGGNGGWGNTRFARPSRQAPDYAYPGKPGEERTVRLELKLLADVGLVGFPNAGKSTFLSKVSAARPKIAAYPFTTLVPNLGIVKYYDYKSFVIADIPGLIEGAHKGKGLGHQFLKHIERTRILVVLISAETEDIEKEYEVILNELKKFGKKLISKKRLPVISKSDIIHDGHNVPELLDGIKPICMSSVTGEGVKQVLDAAGKAVFSGE